MPQRAGTVAAGDVTGKGIRAVLVMAGMRTLLRAAAPPPIFPGSCPGRSAICRSQASRMRAWMSGDGQ